MARPKKPVALTVQEMAELASVGYTDEQIAELAGISETTLSDRFRAALKKARLTTKVGLRAKLIEEAMNGNTAALIFACKTIAGLRETLPDAAQRITIVDETTDPALCS